MTDHAARLFARKGYSSTFFPFNPFGFEHLQNYIFDDMLPDIDLPTESIDRVEDDRLAEVAPCLESIPTLRTNRADPSACTLGNRISVMKNVRNGWRKWRVGGRYR